MIAGGFDLSIGSVAGFVGMLSSVLMLENFAVPTPLVFIIAIAIGCIFGLINGLIITKIGINPIITTLGTLSIIRGACYFSDLSPRIYNVVIQDLGRKFLFNTIPYTTIYIVVFFVALSLILKFTRFGRDLYTIEEMKLLQGLQVLKLTE